ncbi:type II toxin-antitoxin system Phd/YefM family antitoxin [Micromonospora sediminimaris]|uniref:Prevent-host-death family protein n=1 Tax=Micromonospora sediminimaris TaxID=547162 RepID=A0A9W5UND9_9ACTN|nr:type II toxin-antitoxin system prevent-host-death family antitoxin [Micromonospora sediminimaris]GIJ31659.1 hypothetical protein Vse01_08070 [Micromonospora sediminimaris]SFB80237.1 prevent-host-death family protein [Micromonospora sediminimaris]
MAKHAHREITQRELRNESGSIMRGVERGDSFIITRNGTPIGKLIPLRQRTEATFDPLPFDAEAAGAFGLITGAVPATGRTTRRTWRLAATMPPPASSSLPTRSPPPKPERAPIARAALAAVLHAGPTPADLTRLATTIGLTLVST